MRILEICINTALGGLELYFHRCCVELQKRGHLAISVTLAGSRLEELNRKNSIPTHAMDRGFRHLPVSQARQLARLIDEKEIDLVHSHHSDDLPLLALAKSFARRRFKLVFTRQMPMKQAKKDFYHRWLYTSIDRFLTITELLKRDAIRLLPIPSERIARLYYGVAPAPVRDEAFERQFLSISKPGDLNIGVFSRLEFQKGQHLVIDALKLLKDRKIPARLYIVGDVMFPQYKVSMEEQIKKHELSSEVIFKGFLSSPRLAMPAMDVMILPSRNEAFGLVLIEAMHAGVAVMGVNAGGVPEIIDHKKTGLLFEWDNPSQLADMLAELYSNPALRKELGAAGKEKAKREFGMEMHFDRLEVLFKEVLA